MSVSFSGEAVDARDALLVVAFAGWNDAAESATMAARYLVRRFRGRRVARIQPDDFFQFSDHRPLVRIGESGERRIAWPSNEFFHCRTPARDLIVGVGVEPHLKWKRFGRGVLEVGNRFGARMMVTLGALLAGGLHTQPSHLVAVATDPALLAPSGVETTRYEGPTGIVGVIHALMQDEGLPAVSLWANVPHYIASLSNPKAARALLESLGAVGGFEVSLGDFDDAIRAFDEKVEKMVAGDPRIAKYVDDVQKGQIPDEIPGLDFDDSLEPEPDEPEDSLPPGDQVADEIERLMRRRPGGPEPD